MAAPGHMAHLFEIPSVRTGSDLQNVFNQTANFLQQNTASVKIDGINVSLRLTTINGIKQFVIDRGSNKPLDVKGVTLKDLQDRFGAGHPMINICSKVLKIFNLALPLVRNELISLGLWNNPNILFNVEYVEGKTNVQHYNNNFLSVHGLLEIEQATPTRRQTKEIPYSKDELNRFISKMEPYAKSEGFLVAGSIDAKLELVPNFIFELDKEYVVKYDNFKKDSKSLGNWLQTCLIPKEDTIRLKSNKTVKALSKEIFINILNGIPLSDFIESPSDYPKAINGFITYLASVKLGDCLLKALTSSIGPVHYQEGIVVRNFKIYDKPYKVTGTFIIRGMDSPFKN
jgi:hypothetical protein